MLRVTKMVSLNQLMFNIGNGIIVLLIQKKRILCTIMLDHLDMHCVFNGLVKYEIIFLLINKKLD